LLSFGPPGRRPRTAAASLAPRLTFLLPSLSFTPFHSLPQAFRGLSNPTAQPQNDTTVPTCLNNTSPYPLLPSSVSTRAHFALPSSLPALLPFLSFCPAPPRPAPPRPSMRCGVLRRAALAALGSSVGR
jgi:hypothetical protein